MAEGCAPVVMSTTRSILMNDVTIVGNLTADPVYRVTERNARGVVRFDVAVNRRRFDRDSNQYVDLPPVYHRVVAFGPLADNANESLHRGLEVVVVGNFADDTYEKEGEKRRQMVLEAQVIAASLRFATAEVKKAQRMTATQQESKEAYDGE
jgi:single-strand DNA-binding protein